jgi:hypothetical protein
MPLSLLANGLVKIPDHVAVSLCVCVSPLSLLGNGSVKNAPIVASQWLGKNPLIVPRQRLGKNSPMAARQRLGRNVTAVTNTQAIEELLDASSMWPV